MIDVAQALKNNIITMCIIVMATSGLSFVAGLCVKSEIYDLAIVTGIASVGGLAIGLYKWDQILTQIKMLKENQSYVEPVSEDK